MNHASVIQLLAKELRYLLYSPIGWIVAALFVASSSFQYSSTLVAYFERLSGGVQPDSFAEVLFTSGFNSVFQETIHHAYLLIPLICMAVFSRELQSESIKLLMSSPLRPSEMVLGKFLGVALYLLSFIGFLAFLVLISAAIIPNFDVMATIPGLLGLYLLFCAYSAIGVFFSSLTKHQVIAAIVTLATLFVLQSVERWFQTVPIVNELVAWVSIAGRANTLRAGLLSTPDVIYFLAIIASFLLFTILRVGSFRSGESTVQTLFKGLLCCSIIIVLGWTFSLPQLSGYYDTTYDQRNSLAPETQALMSRIQGPWEIETHANVLDDIGWSSWPRNRVRDRNRYSRYRHLNHELKMGYLMYYDIDGADGNFRRPGDGRSDAELVRRFSKRIGVNFDQLPSGPEFDERTDLDLNAEEYRTLRVIRWRGREVILRHFDDAQEFPAERATAAALKRLLDGPVVVGVTTGSGERSLVSMGPDGYRESFTRLGERWSLVNHGFEFVDLGRSRSIPPEIEILVIADPRLSFDSEMLSSLIEFIETGGNMVLLIDPKTDESINSILLELGVTRGQVVERSDLIEGTTDFLLAKAETGVFDSYWGDTNARLPVAIDEGTSLRPSGLESEFRIQPIITFENQTLGLALERNVAGKNQRIVILGDADLFSNANAQRREPVSNTATAFDTFHWLTNGDYPVQRTRRETVDRSIVVDGSALNVIRWALVGGLPLFLLFSGGALLNVRRRR